MSSQATKSYRTHRGSSGSKPKKAIKRLSQLLTDNIESELYRKFETIMNTKRKQYLKLRLCHYYGKNFPINYKDHYGFEQQWEGKANTEGKHKYQQIEEYSWMRILMLLLRLVVYILTIWFSNIEFFIRKSERTSLYSSIFIIALMLQIFKLVMVLKELKNKVLEMSGLQIIKMIYKSVFVIFHLCLKLGLSQVKDYSIWTISQLIFIYVVYSKARQIYQSIRLMSFAIHYEYQSKLLDLITTLIIIAHFIAIILHLSTQIGNYSVSWQSNLDFDKENQFIVYLYSFYFGSTTILTVGYGDISPKNPAQVAIVTLTEIFGIVMFAYIINEIGYSISSLRKQREEVERDLSTMEKIKKHYHMEDSLAQRARSYIINHKPNVDQLVPQEETRLLTKFNQQLRNQLENNNLKMVVKSSLFLIIRWSKTFQSALATKLIHVLFSPNDLLYQPAGRQRIYVLRSGKINILATAYGSKKMKNLLKTLHCSIDREVCDNCYGYTSVISSKPARLYAIAKDFVSCYYVEKEHFMDCVDQRISDIQFYHELKNKIDLSECKQAIEVPACQSSKNHYNPTKASIIRKFTKCRQYDQRQLFTRFQRANYRSQKILVDKSMHTEIINRYRPSCDIRIFDLTEHISHEENSFTRKPSLTRKSIFKSEESIESSQMKQNCFIVGHDFQSAKEYANYFSKGNLYEALRRYESQQFMTKGNISKSLSMKIMKTSRRPQLK